MALRLSGDAFEPEIKDNINSALLELSRVGVDVSGITYDSEDADELVVKACELYCKWHFDFIGKAERYEKNFNELRNALSVTTRYTEGNA